MTKKGNKEFGDAALHDEEVRVVDIELDAWKMVWMIFCCAL